MNTQTYTITGMTCASCSRAVERTTSKMEGVTEAQVNLATETLVISFDEAVVTPDNIIATIEKAGYMCFGVRHQYIIIICFTTPKCYNWDIKFG